MLAFVEALKRFESYLIGRKFTWVTDNQSLVYPTLGKTGHSRNRLMRWWEYANGFDFNIVKSEGTAEEMLIADTLSRIPGNCSSEEYKINVLHNDMRISIKEIEKSQQGDENFMLWWEKSKHNKKFEIYDNVVRYKRTLYKEDKEHNLMTTLAVPVIPDVSNLRERIIIMIHSKSHSGINETILRIKNVCWWKGLRKQVTEKINSCEICLKVKADNKPMRPVIMTDTPETYF